EPGYSSVSLAAKAPAAIDESGRAEFKSAPRYGFGAHYCPPVDRRHDRWSAVKDRVLSTEHDLAGR
ncbi:MAG: hypothetical protein KDI09_21670, partial [Halioglobus sp.]|nr:hypothetical protein [Halioglobus sp.]